MKKFIFLILLFVIFMCNTNVVYASDNMIASNGDYKINFVTLNPNTFRLNDFYYGQKLNNLLSFTEIYTINNDKVDIQIYWENPEYELLNGYQSIDLYFINPQSGNKVSFTLGVYCNTYIFDIKPLRILQ